MNKQAIIFLSLFSLTLVLSVYYITLPQDLINNNVPASNLNNVNFEQMWQQLEAKHQETIDENSLIVSSSSVSESEKLLAVQTLEVTKKVQDIEKNLASMIKEAGYEDVYVEIDENLCKVLIKGNNKDEKDATKVINIVLTQTDSKYLPEIKFVS